MSSKTRRQYAALPMAVAADGLLRVLLVTSRESGRWVIPKGWPIKGLSPSEVALREAREEAGLVGRIVRTGIKPCSLGVYHYDKRLASGVFIPCEVVVFPMAVTRQLEKWRERGQRVMEWVSPDEAAGRVAEPELGMLIRSASLPPDIASRVA